MEEIKNEECPMCNTKNLVLREDTNDIPHFGKVFIFSMTCSKCNYHMSDVECEGINDPSRYTFTIENEKDLNVKVIKSGTATVKIPQLRMDSRPGPASIGFISNMEGLLKKFEDILISERDSAEDNEARTAAKNLLKKIWKVKCGDIPLKIVIEDPNGNSAILSDKAIVEKMKVK
ncbi:MAG: ZPR1 zinc finger domain-containing protein [Nanoarchaeota archaeon]|nr:ZPR1 zinc finger domain-containing protein [Nanoarchaeota archaeon]MBU0962724.1 ZPR1 zinc finger domain-containing protein [Nanoarchaeota archaeon]